jgi:cold shock CspA family protein
MAKILKCGTVKCLFIDKGFGFIVPDEKGAADVFFHITRYNGSTPFAELKEGQKLSYYYEVRESGKIRATQVFEVE